MLHLLTALALSLFTLADDGAEELALDAIKRLKSAVGEDQVDRVEGLLFELDEVYPACGERTQGKIIKAIGGLLKAKPRNVRDEDGRPPELRWERSYSLAAGIVYDKPGGAELLRSALKARHTQEWFRVRALLYEALSFSRDRADLKLFKQGLEEGHAEVVAGAARALAAFDEAEIETRREATTILIESWERLHDEVAKAERRKSGEAAAELLRSVELAFADGFSALTRRRQKDLESARAWYDEHAAGDDW